VFNYRAREQGGRELRIEPEQLPSIVEVVVGLAADLIDPAVD
jgi:hypothetical protein